MAQRAGKMTARAIALGVVALTLGTAAVVLAQGRGATLAPADLAAIRFTLLQAALSAVASALLAIPVARALARRRFAGREVLILLLGAPFLLPVIVAVLGLLAVLGRSGLLNRALAVAGWPEFAVYGLQGVVLAHLFLNLPLAVRMILQGWQAIPAERFRLAQSLDFPPPALFRHLELPMLRAVLPGAFVTIFVLCLTSFAIALTLGGGPRATTVELAIYQALRFDFDLGRAAALAAVQFALCGAAVALGALVARQAGFGSGIAGPMACPAPAGWRRVADGAAIGAAALFLLLPLALVLLRGLGGLGQMPAAVWPAAARSVAVALPSGLICVAAALALALAAAKGARWIEGAATLPLAASGLVMGTGLFILINPLISPEKLALPVTMLVNATLALPFVFRLILPDCRTVLADYGRLMQALDLRGATALRWVILPRLARPLGLGAGVAMALSMGDLGVIALFAGDGQATLPLMVQRLMGAYRTEAAAGAALVLVTLSFGIFALCDWGGRRAAA